MRQLLGDLALALRAAARGLLGTDVETEAQTGQESPVEPQGYEEAAKGGSSQVSRAPAPLSLPLDVVKNPCFALGGGGVGGK